MTKTVGSTVKDLAGNPLSGVRIKIELVQAEPFVTSSKVSLAPSILLETDATGNWATALAENDLLSPSGTLYRITEHYPKKYGRPKEYLIQVLSSLGGGTNQAYDLLVPSPSPVGVTGLFVTKAYADATYSPVGTSVGPAGPPGPPGTSALVSATEATLLASTVDNGILGYATDTDRFYVRRSSTWKYLPNGKAEEFAQLLFTPAGNTDATTSGTYTDWISLGSVTVPPWASVADVTIQITGVSGLTAVPTQYQLRFLVGTATSTDFVPSSPTAISSDVKMDSYNDRLTSVPTGSQTVKVQMKRISGTGVYRVNTASRMIATLRYRPA